MRKLLLILSLLPFFSYGTIATNGHFQIKDFWVWNNEASNVMIIRLLNQDEVANTHCPGGYWVDKTDSTGSHLLNVALTAYHNKTKVKIFAYEDQDWPSMAAKECKIALIALEPLTN